MRARVVYFEAPRSVRVREERVEPGPDEHAVTSELIGISHGTEMLFYRGPFPRGQELEARATIGNGNGYPVKYGYMNVGVLDDGSRVFGFYPHQDRFAARPDHLLPVPDGIESEDAILYPSVETAIQIVHDAGPRLGERVLVSGLGVIGLLVVQLLRRVSLEVVAADPVPQRRERAAAFGCAVLDPASPDAPDIVRTMTGELGPDLAINTSAREEALQLALDTLAPEGTVVEASWYGEHETRLRLGTAFHRKRLSIRSSQVSTLNPAMRPRWSRTRRTELAWRLMRELRPGRLITHRFQLDEAATAYDLIAERPEEVLQVVLVP